MLQRQKAVEANAGRVLLMPSFALAAAAWDGPSRWTYPARHAVMHGCVAVLRGGAGAARLAHGTRAGTSRLSCFTTFFRAWRLQWLRELHHGKRLDGRGTLN